MSITERTRKTSASRTSTKPTSPARQLRSAADKPIGEKARTDAEDKLWAVLHAHPNTTSAHLATAAKIGRSTAQKILVKWATEGSATRIPGTTDTGRRPADTWAIADPDTPPDASDAEPDHGDDPQQDNVAEAPDVPDSDDADDVDDDGQGSTGTEPVTSTAAEPATENVGDHTHPSTTEVASDAPTTRKRLAPGALHGMVEDYLRDHPNEDFGPVAIATALGGKSSGAVSNALDRMVKAGIAVRTSYKPKRYALVPAEKTGATVSN
jgi:hypothetical protein